MAGFARPMTLLESIRNKLGGTLDARTDAAKYAEAFDESLRAMIHGRRPRAWDEKRFENLVAAAEEHVSIKLGSTLVKDQTKHHAAKFFGETDRIWVLVDDKTRYLDELSEIVAGMPERIWRGRLYVDEGIRHQVKLFCKDWLETNRSTGETDGSATA